MTIFPNGGPLGRRIVRTTVFAALAVLVATSLGGCFLFPKRATVVPGTLGTGRVEGQVLDEHGRAVVGASATIPEAAQYTAVSGADGRFAFPGLAPGTYYVLIDKEGYLAGSYGVTVETGQAARLQAVLIDSSGHLHGDSRRVPNLCGDCHQLHNPTDASHLTKGATPNSACANCHGTAGVNGGFDQSVYEASPHGRGKSVSSSTLPVWPGQASTERGNCVTCHEPHGIAGPPLMLRRGTQDADGTVHLSDLCLACHAAAGTGNTAGWPGSAAYTNGANLHLQAADSGTKYAAGDCGVCHVPHGRAWGGVNDPTMLRRQGNQLCLKCHPGKATTQSGHGNCTMCHDPHNIQKAGGVLYVKNPADPNGPQIPAPKEGYRNETLMSGTDYCQKCHKTPAASGLPETPKDPLASTTRFWNQQALSDRNLHNVHVNRIWAPGTPNHYGTGGNVDRVHCGQCHTTHQSSLGHNLNSKYLSSASGTYSGNWSAKSGCGVQSGCHTCNWCHNAPGSPGGSPACYECYYHGYNPHQGVTY